MQYDFNLIEKKWREYWQQNNTYAVTEIKERKKYYVLDMFPYPSGAGLHVGHPLGYIASDVFARYKKLMGYNVLHPMGYDSFGLPAEQFAIETGQHPAITTERNIQTYRRQLDLLGFSFDWNREIRTSQPDFYRWTQWIFIQLFNSWYNISSDKAESIETLIATFCQSGTENLNAACTKNVSFSAVEWNNMNEKQQHELLLNYRLAYLSDTVVNWCPNMGTVLANDEVRDGFSIRGGFKVEQKKMKQWSLRISAYANRLLTGLESIDWPTSIKEIQKNWIGRSEGAMVHFSIENSKKQITVFTTRPDTIFGVSFMVLAPEHELVDSITTPEHKKEIDNYKKYANARSERDRLSDIAVITGSFTGSYAIHPFNDNKIPIWIGDYVLAGYGTGAVMAVPSGDQRDWNFAQHFNIPIIPIVQGVDISKSAYTGKEGVMVNSDFLNSLALSDAIDVAISKIEKLNLGYKMVNYRIRDAVFGRQRYWGEPIPVFYKEGIPYVLDEKELPLVLPEIDSYLPSENGEPPLSRAKNWTFNNYPLETTTMPGWAGSSWYYLRYMDADNETVFTSKEAMNYWNQVDLYIGGAEHTTGHLLYVRFWAKFLFDRGFIPMDEPAKKLVNQGMIQGLSAIAYKIKNKNTFVSASLRNDYDTMPTPVDINLVDGKVLNIEQFKLWRPDNGTAEFIMEDGKFLCERIVEKMSKSKFNVQTPDKLIKKYGADTLRLYEMFLGPLEDHKPWSEKGIEGTHRFLKKLWCLFFDEEKMIVTDEEPNNAELKILHQTIKKVQDDIERLSLNTVVSEYMICVNELGKLNCHKKSILSPLVVLLAPYVPHIAEELWHQLGNANSVTVAAFPKYDEKYITEDTFEYPVSFNGKLRFTIKLSLSLDSKQIEESVLQCDEAQKRLHGIAPKRVIIVPKKIVNIVV